VFAISTDPPGESAKFARNYAIDFPLLADEDGAVSRAYVGVNYDDTTIPGIAIIRRDGTIAYRQIAEAKDDRLTTEQLFATIDRTLGTHGDAVRAGYATPERIQLHLDAGGGGRTGDGAIATADLAVLVPVARQLALGGWLALGSEAVVDADVAAAVRYPLLHGTGAIQLTLTAGWSSTGPGYNLGARVGPWIAISPTWALHLDVGAIQRGDDHEAIATFGVSRLFER
jgi:AhpC/TSA family protein